MMVPRCFSARLICHLLLGALLLGAAGPLWAQDPGSGGPAPAAEPTAVPLDAGVSGLLAAGAAYALRRLRRRA